MVRVFITEGLREDLVKYVKKAEYTNCIKDLCDFFLNKSIGDIFSQPILISPNKDFNFIKSRLPNSSLNKGKSGGYRVYYYVDIRDSIVYLIGFYPKTGKYGCVDLTSADLKACIRKFIDQKNMQMLIEFSIRKSQDEIIQALKAGRKSSKSEQEAK